MNKNKLKNLKKTALISALLLEMSSAAFADTIVVDGTTCTLHDAITSANEDMIIGGCSAGSGADVLELSANADIVLTTALPNIYNALTINGNNATIRREDTSPAFSLLSIENDDLTLNDVTLSGGKSLNGANRGAAIYGFYSALTINNSVITNNTGGAIYNYSSTLHMTDTQVTNNSSHPSSGSAGIRLNGASNSNITGSTISGNQNFGGAKGAAIFISNSYFYGSNVTVSNSTISGNSSESGGGAIQVLESYYYQMPTSAVLTLRNVTVTNNNTDDDGGAAVVEVGRLALNQTLISNNSGASVNEILNSGGSVVTDGFNLIGLDGSSGSVGLNVGATDTVIAESDINMVLNPILGNHGGQTPTHLLNPSGPAVDFIPSASCLLATDQAGRMRPVDGDGDGTADCDVGALEYADIIFKNGFE